MAIVGLTDKRTEDSVLVFPQIGTLRKGGKKQGNKPGPDLDYFRFTSTNPDAVTMFGKLYKAKPKIIHSVVLPFKTVEENFPTWKEEWSASRLKHRCDGVTVLSWYDAKNKQYSNEPKECPGGCKEIGRLTVVLSDMMKAGFIGTTTVLTHAKWDLLNINNSLAYYYAQNNDLRGIEWVLSREPKERPSPDGPRRMKHEIQIRPHQQWAIAALQLEAKLQDEIESGWVVEESHQLEDGGNGVSDPDPDPQPDPVQVDFEEETEPDPEPKEKPTKKATALRHFHVLGRFLYGTQGNWDKTRPVIVGHASDGKKKSSKDLTLKELLGVNNTLKQKQKSFNSGEWDIIYSHLGKMLDVSPEAAQNTVLQMNPDMFDDGFVFKPDWFKPLITTFAGLVGADLDDAAVVEKASNFFRKEAFGELPL